MKKKKLKKERRMSMSTGGDSAEEIVRLSLEGFEVVARISGSMAKNVAIMLYTMSKDTNKKTKGRTNLTNIMKSKSDLRVFYKNLPILRKIQILIKNLLKKM